MISPGTPKTAPADFGFGENEADLRDVVRRFLDEQFPVTRLRELVATDHEAVYDRGEPAGWDRELWDRLVEMAWPGLPIAESAGGSDLALAGLVAVVEEVGAHALPSPLISTYQAALLLAECDPTPAQPWLESIAAGTTATIAVTNPQGSWRLDDTAVVAATGAGGETTLTGRAGFVQDAAKADFFVVQCTVGGGHQLVVVGADAAGLTIEPDRIHDLTRDQATLVFDSVAVDDVAIVSDKGLGALGAAWPAILTLISADLCGSAEWLLQTTVDYAKNRVQFERPIGFFQAVKHPLVDVMVGIDQARSLTYHAAAQIDANAADALVAARMAKSAASDAAGYAADRAVQLHGGIGFTWEHDVHLFFKRIMHNKVLYGDGRYQRRELASAIIDR